MDGVKFDSKWESERYLYLKSLERAGTIKNLELQPRFPMVINDVKICTYVADFQYDRQLPTGDWENIVEDAKGVETPEFKIKKKLMKAVHDIDILLTKKRH